MEFFEEYWEIAKLNYSKIDEISTKYNLNSDEKFALRHFFSVYLFILDTTIEKKMTKSDTERQINKGDHA